MTWINGEWADSTYETVHQWCPICDPVGEKVSDPWETRYCDAHYPERIGALDHVTGPTEYLAVGEAGGEANTRLCDLIHGRTT